MKFCWCTINVKNLEESLKFYQEIVGLSTDKRLKAGPTAEVVFLGDGETKVELIYDEANTAVNIGQDISLGFETDSLDRMIELLEEKGVQLHSGPFQPNPHTKFIFVLDPNGVKIQFCQNF